MRDIAPVAEFDLSKSYEFVHETFGETAQSCGPALNVNTLGEVPDSSWFTNRLGRRDMTIDDVVRGPNQVDGPAPGTWQVTGRPDSRHHAEVHDPRRARRHLPDQARSGANPRAAVVGRSDLDEDLPRHRLPRARGLHRHVRRRRGSSVAPGAKIRTASGDEAADRDGGRRAVAEHDAAHGGRHDSRAGEPLRARQGRRPVPLHRHAARRSERHLPARAAARAARPARLRRLAESRRCAVDQQHRHLCRGGRPPLHPPLPAGLRLESRQRQHVGAAAARRQRVPDRRRQDRQGPRVVRTVDSATGRRSQYPDNPSLGNIEADFFEPAKWKTEYPQPAFDQMDAADAFWAASIVVALHRRDDPGASSTTGELSDPDAARAI